MIDFVLRSQRGELHAFLSASPKNDSVADARNGHRIGAFMANSIRSWVLAFCLLLPATRISAQLAPLVANVTKRTTTSLNGQWQVIVDPYDVGSIDYRAQPLKRNNAFYKDYKPKSKSEQVAYDFDSSGHQNVLGDRNTQRDSLLFYEGSVWYRRTFTRASQP
jgi:beta-glucuronidase